MKTVSNIVMLFVVLVLAACSGETRSGSKKSRFDKRPVPADSRDSMQLPNPDPDESAEDMRPVRRGAEERFPEPGLPAVSDMQPALPAGGIQIETKEVEKRKEHVSGVLDSSRSAIGWGGIGLSGGAGLGGKGGGGAIHLAPVGRTMFSRPPSRGFMPDFDARRDNPDFNTESYQHLAENPFIRVAQDPRSTFSVDVDTAAYANMRRMILEGRRPPADAVRIEEMINYFNYGYAGPSDPSEPFAVHTEVTESPWSAGRKLVRIGIQGRRPAASARKPSNLVFLIDVSGSMMPANKLPLLVRSLKLLVNQLTASDRVAIVVYAGAEGLALPSTSCGKPAAILEVLDKLNAGGSTNGGAGIQLAYRVARENFIPGGINRVILATDGDFNVGVTGEGELLRIVEEQARANVFLTVLGFGMGNYKDGLLETLSNKGNGNYAYIDSLLEAQKVLVEQMGGTLDTIAKDVKLQVEFNPRAVAAFRLIGYENRVMAHQDFNDDAKDAGDIGAGHTVTALYEIIPPGQAVPEADVDPLKYQTPPAATQAAEASGELLTLKIRFKAPEGKRSELRSFAVKDEPVAFSSASSETRWAAAVAAFGMLLKDSKYKGEASLEQVLSWAQAARGADLQGYRAEFIELVQKSRSFLASR